MIPVRRHDIFRMLVPVACFSCNKRVGSYWIPFCNGVHQGRAPGAVLDDMNITRMCCRRVLLTSVELNSLWVEHECVEKDMSKIHVERYSEDVRTLSTD